MNKRLRKKKLDKLGSCKYPAKPKETWSLFTNIAEYVLPRLKLFKRLNKGYPGRDEADTPEKWDAILNKMIVAFEYIIDENWWMNDPRYDYTDGLHIFCGDIDENTGYGTMTVTEDDWVDAVKKEHNEEEKRRQRVITNGLNLFAKWYRDLWW